MIDGTNFKWEGFVIIMLTDGAIIDWDGTETTVQCISKRRKEIVVMNIVVARNTLHN